MRLPRQLIAATMIATITFGMSRASSAGDLRDSIDRAAQEQARAASAPKIPNSYLVPGVALFAAGMTMAVYGFLHTSGGEFVSGEVSKESKTGLGAAGLAVAGAGGVLLFVGSERAKHAPSVTVAPGGVSITKRLAW